ncbi:anaerobic glycerol-3-phosphate dehydrogenase subunit C [Bythopirellula polymerisocia]|uniref:Anaerobic glycerol-3-phosphate dehydrogenase subunit C n=1 Tax=Bythopirellula polymerisocia TaxID=2528003 RepID=A0A5C6CMQ3_9BACT|nr:anaerobic glycerol-3-phosphate dehydrogenase subunit C [Bythopirellula polymerisocia]TWU25662.1 Anaerobic glycerol-3-phosphate dehydrogenase subunit C [Bythopirellula polymerisocia]
MEVERQRIQEDLRGQIAGDVYCDDLYVQLYASDASIYEISPLGVVRPRNVEDVVATVKYAAANEIPLHARGSGSGLAGGALGRGLVVDFSRYLRKVLMVDEETVRVEAGIVLDDLNRHLASRGRYFGPDPATKQVTTIGSMVALDASGSHWPVVGSARRHVKSLQVVMADGDVKELGLHNIPLKEATTDEEQLAADLSAILENHQDAILKYHPKSCVNCSGYQLDNLHVPGFGGSQLNLAHLLVGSEGTLGLVTEATLSTLPLPEHVLSILLFFNSLDKAAHATLEMTSLGPSACDLMDRRHLSIARESDPRYEFLIPLEAEAVLLVEFQADSDDEIQERLAQTVTLIKDKLRLASGAYIAADKLDHDLLWQLARHYTPTLYRLKGLTRPLPFIEDIAVPPESLPDFLPRAQQLFRQEQTTTSLFGHVGHGQLHIRPFLDLANSEDIGKMDLLADQLYEEVWRVGGTISGEHGDGLSRTPFVARQFGPLASAFQEVKQLFDPNNLLNPGKIVPAEVSGLSSNLRHVRYPLLDSVFTPTTEEAKEKTALPARIELQLAWQPEEMAHAARTCNGCAACRTLAEETRMCPIFRYSPREEASPRAKANLVRGVLTGSLPAETLLESDCKEIVDLCVHCHMCRLECPAVVDIPKLMVEAKASYMATNGESLHGWFMSRIDRLCFYGSNYNRVANWAIGNHACRWVIEKLLGISRSRKLPRFRSRPFLQCADQQKIQLPEKTGVEMVLYFVDTYANYCDSQLAEAFVAVLEHNGVPVYIPPRQQESAMPYIARGHVSLARKIAEANVALLAEAIRQGYTIVATEPSAVLALTHEYLQLLPDDQDAEMVSKNTYEACHYIWRLHQRGKLLLDFDSLDTSLGYHTPCHIKALGIGSPTQNLLGLIPGLKIEQIEKGCSGIAGMYGFQRDNYRNSLRAGLPLITEMRNGLFAAGTTECSTCKIQMEQSTSKPTIHPVKVLALAYGLMPELRQLLDSPGRDLVVT